MKKYLNALVLTSTVIFTSSVLANDVTIKKGSEDQEKEIKQEKEYKYVPFSTAQFNARTQYRTGSKRWLQMFRIAGVVKQPDSLLKGTYWSLETNSNMGRTLDEFAASYQEIEVNKAFWKKKFYVSPGFVWHWESAGTQFDPYVEAGYRWDTTFSTAVRYRYNHWTYLTKDVNKNNDTQGEHRIDLYVKKNFTPEFQVTYNPTYYHKRSGTEYFYKNDKKSVLQHNFIFSYQMSDRFIPYTELGYLDKTKNDEGNKVHEYQIRLGFRYNLN
ncbi:hypothetical protein PEC311524_22420 [Pectobacterium carotovorum subsp. carotovorum]|nr:hypothetical protein PEC311524_22420 [Pectobacterium carotovorum subsp. carotovorum]